MSSPATAQNGSRRGSRDLLLLGAIAIGVAVVGSKGFFAQSDRGRPIPPPQVEEPAAEASSAVAVLAGGCFWGVQGVFQHVKGVTNAVSGYAGGTRSTAQYDTVSEGDTGHAETVQITYDPRQISYARLLQIYFSVAHNPTEKNRQGPDVGTQYRSTIFPVDETQARIARAYIDQLNAAKIFKKPIATTIEPNKPFYAAEAYHQDYLTRHPREPYIMINDLPKVDDLKKIFADVYRPDPVLVRGSR
jgi:peptide-methionine (S)-S-oxide reductase